MGLLRFICLVGFISSYRMPTILHPLWLGELASPFLIFHCTWNASVSGQSRHFQVKNGCASLKVVDGLLNVDPAIPQATWFQTPSVVEIGAGHYQALGRVIHLKKFKGAAKREARPKLWQSKKNHEFRSAVGYSCRYSLHQGSYFPSWSQNCNMFARELISFRGSKMDLCAELDSGL